MDSFEERPLLAVVGGDSLVAKEIREQMETAIPRARVQLITAATEAAMVLAPDEEDVAVMAPLNAESLLGARVVFLAGSQASSRKALKLTDPAESMLIDLSGALEDRPNARLRAPLAEPIPPSDATPQIQVIAHSASIALTVFLSALSKAGKIKRSLIHAFEPASERGKKGLEELRQQTVAVLSFQKLKRDVFDTQVSFNLVARYGEEAMEPLESVEERMEKHLATLLSAWPGIPMPSLRLIQAPVFHGYSFSVWAELEDAVNVKTISKTLAAAQIDVRSDEPPSNIGAAGQSGLSVGAIHVDRNNPRAFWFWLVTDNLRLAADNAIATAKEFL